jgi:hypothetical protein
MIIRLYTATMPAGSRPGIVFVVLKIKYKNVDRYL